MDIEMSSAQLRLVRQSIFSPRMLEKCLNACWTWHGEAFSLIHRAFHYTIEWALDQDGLSIYHTIRGTNSVEGGVHMAVRRVFGSLQASPELAECLLLNWTLRRNKTVRFK
jgi:hypothetical protein